MMNKGETTKKVSSAEEANYERDHQRIGRYEVFIYGQDVGMFHIGLESMRTLNPREAMMLLEWLNQHRETLNEAAEGTARTS